MRHLQSRHAGTDAPGRGLAWAVPVLALAVVLTAAAPLSTPHRHKDLDGLQAAQSGGIVAEANPAAVLAWAKANCDSGLELASGAPRTHMDIILQVAATYDAEGRRRGVAAVCADALAATSSITAP